MIHKMELGHHDIYSLYMRHLQHRVLAHSTTMQNTREIALMAQDMIGNPREVIPEATEPSSQRAKRIMLRLHANFAQNKANI